MSTIENLVNAVKAKDQADAQAALQRVKDTLGLDELDAQAEARINLIARRATELSRELDKTAINPRDREAILTVRPKLEIYFDNVEQQRKHLRAITFGVQATLSEARAAYAALTAADLDPRPEYHELWIHTRRGVFSPTIWHLYESVANNALPPASDIDDAITKLQTSFNELQERLKAVTV